MRTSVRFHSLGRSAANGCAAALLFTFLVTRIERTTWVGRIDEILFVGLVVGVASFLNLRAAEDARATTIVRALIFWVILVGAAILPLVLIDGG